MLPIFLIQPTPDASHQPFQVLLCQILQEIKVCIRFKEFFKNFDQLFFFHDSMSQNALNLKGRSAIARTHCYQGTFTLPPLSRQPQTPQPPPTELKHRQEEEICAAPQDRTQLRIDNRKIHVRQFQSAQNARSLCRHRSQTLLYFPGGIKSTIHLSLGRPED